jgi:hypothetical protein
MDFLKVLMTDFNADRDGKCSQIASKAYKSALAPYHPWALQKVAGIAMNAVSRRDKVVASFVTEQTKLLGSYDEIKLY